MIYGRFNLYWAPMGANGRQSHREQVFIYVWRVPVEMGPMLDHFKHTWGDAT